MTAPTFTVGDTAPDLTGSVNASLVGADVRLHIQRPDRSVIDAGNTSGLTILNAADGTWSYAWSAGDLAQQGIYYVELQATYADGTVQTFAGDSTVRFYARNQYA